MIVISGSPLQLPDFTPKYPPNSVERLLLVQMSESGKSYRFDSPEQLRFELQLRSAIVDASKSLSRSGLRFEVFHKSECNPEYWNRSGSGGFRLKEGASPAAAIRDIFKNGKKYATECATAMVIVYFGALLNVFGEEAFNRLFPSIYLMNWHGLPSLLKEVGSLREVADILPGDRCYFRNPDVDPKTPEMQGENVIVLTDGKYYGHGVGIAGAEKIIRLLNLSREKDSQQSAYFVENSAGRPNFKRLAAAYGTQTAAVQPSA